jgi:RND superfamily putative drug exporter
MGDRLATLLIRHRVAVLVAWIGAAVVLVPRGVHLERRLEVGGRVTGSESNEVARELAERFGSAYVEYAVAVVDDAPSPLTPAGRAVLDSLVLRLRPVEGVTGVRAYAGPRDSLLLSPAGRSSLLIVGLDAIHASPDQVVARMRAATASFHGATVRWTGQAALNADLRGLSASDARGAERRVLPASLLMLLLAFGTLVAATLPVLAGSLTIAVVFGAVGAIAAHWSLNIIVQNVASMIGLGLGIDYTLLVVSRFREELAAGNDPRAAARETVRHAGRTIAISGLAVAIGFAGLLTLPANALRSVGVGGLATVTVAVLIAVTLAPVLLSWIGSGIDRGRVPGLRPPTRRGERWRRWGEWVARRPLRVLAVAGLPVALLAWPVHRMRMGEPGGDWLPRELESATALRELAAMNRSRFVETIRVVLELPAGETVRTHDGWAAVGRLQTTLARDPRVSLVRSIASPDGARRLSYLGLLALPDTALRGAVTADRRAVLFDVVPREQLDAAGLVQLARDLRALDSGAIAGAGARLRVGGLPAFRADYFDVVRDGLPVLIVLIMAGTVIALTLGFRSVLVPIKAVCLNLLSVAAGLGTVVLVFQEGHGLGLFGLAAPVDQIFIAIPPLVFCAVFGLSMDYEVFLVDRVAEARDRHASEAAAIAEGLARTGPVITNAAAIMVVVFGAFTLGRVLMMRMLGLALAATVLVDAAIVRTTIGPALLALAGRWNWWPGDRRRRTP